MVAKGIGVVAKHCSTFARFSNGFCPQTEEVYINKRLKEGRVKGGSKKVKTVKIVNIGDPQIINVSSLENLYYD
jgi:hypothetical protein